ncbi:MAG: hypothetical protein ACM32E_31630 [Gemmatimonadota bacterium]
MGLARGISAGGKHAVGDDLHAGLMLGAASLVAAYWADFFTGGHVRSDSSPVYLEFEREFPVADVAGCLAASAVLLRRGHVAAVPAGLAAGSAMAFLGLMDVLFNLEHGMYRQRTSQIAVESLINAACLNLRPVHDGPAVAGSRAA